jgi:glycosyltransferase involved in cell wall biosynthesis
MQGVPASRALGRPVRILFHADYLWRGGLEKKVGKLVSGLDRTRFEPVVSWHRRWGPVGDELVNQGIPVVQIAPSHEDHLATEQIRDFAPDIFHSFSCRKTSADVRNARAAGVPWVVTSRGTIDPQDLPVEEWEIDRNGWTDRIIACSHTVAAACVSREGVAPGDVSTIHNGVRLLNAIPERGGPVCIGYAATYRTLKCHEVLLRAFRAVADRYPRARLLCCGERYDDTRERLEQCVRDLSLGDRVRLLDASTEMDAIYRQMDIYVHPSSVEGFSNSILEAMAYGIPVVAARVGGNPEAVVDGVTGFLVPASDEAELERMLSALLSNAQLCRQFGEAGFERVKQDFSVAKMVRAYEDVYADLIDRGPREERAAGSATSRQALYTSGTTK